MISEQELIILITAVLAMVVFIIVCIRGNKLQLIHKLYLVAAGVLIYWVLALIGMD